MKHYKVKKPFGFIFITYVLLHNRYDFNKLDDGDKNYFDKINKKKSYHLYEIDCLRHDNIN